MTHQLCSRRRPYQGGYCIGACCRPQVLYTYNQAGYKCKGPDSSSIFPLIINTGGYPCKDIKVFNAKNFNQQSLDDKSFGVLNVHSTSGMGGALLVILILLLATLGYNLARYKDYAKECRVWALTCLETLEPSCRKKGQKGNMTEGQEDRKQEEMEVGGPEGLSKGGKKTGGQGGRRTRGQDNRRTGGQEGRRIGGQEDRT